MNEVKKVTWFGGGTGDTLKDACVDYWMSVYCDTDQQMDETLDDEEFLAVFDEQAYLVELEQAGTRFVINGDELGVYN